MDIITKAKLVATIAHAGQIYGDKLPFIVHPEAVYSMLLKYKVENENILAAAWLHDILEDTAVKYSLLSEHFNEKICKIVYDVTDEKGINRRDRHIKTYPKTAQNESAVLLKLGDRLANVTFGVKNNSKLLNAYKNEHPLFKSVLFNEDHCYIIHKMWSDLDSLLV